jgi:uncharacterized delta-60 repeat protein
MALHRLGLTIVLCVPLAASACSNDDSPPTSQGTTDAALEGASDSGLSQSSDSGLDATTQSDAIQLSPASVTLSPGALTTIQVTLIGAQQPVSLSIDNLPLNVAGSFDPPTTASTSLLTLQTGADAISAATSLLVHASGIGFDATQTLAFSVAAPSQPFTLIAAPSALSIVQGREAPLEINIVRASGFTGDVALAFPNLPNGITVTPGSLAIPAGASSVTVSIQVALTVTPSSVSVSIQGGSGSYTSEVSLPLMVPTPQGAIDTTFGNDGYLALTVPDPAADGGGFFQPSGYAMQSTGALLLVGTFNQLSAQNAVMRLTADGSVDDTFASGAGFASLPADSTMDGSPQIYVRADDSFDLGYEALPLDSSGEYATSFKTEHFSKEGLFDTSYGSGGLQTVAGLVEPNADMASTGDVYVVGRVPQQAIASVVHVTQAGLLDNAFGSSGSAQVPVQASDPTMVFPQVRWTPGGIIVGATIYSNDFATSTSVLSRLSSAGQIDGSFGAAGYIYGLEPTLNLNILTSTAAGSLLIGYNDSILRLTAAGLIDTSFGKSGFADVQVTYVQSVTSLPDGRVLWDGVLAVPGTSQAALGRLTPSGTIDPTFGTGGTVMLAASNEYYLAGIFVQPSGKYLVVEANGNGGAIQLVRFYP